MTEALRERPEQDLVDLARAVGTVGTHASVTGGELLDDLRILESIPMPGDPPASPGTNAGFQSV